MKRKISLSTTVSLILLTMALTISLTMLFSMRHFNSQLKQVGQWQGEYEHIHEVDSIVQKYYPNLDQQQLRQGITQGFVDGLGDPYAVYYNPTRYAAERLRLSGKADDTGITLALNSEGRVTVGRVQPNSAAGKAGVKAGDLVTAVDSDPVEGKTLAELHTLLNTAPKVVLTVQRGEDTHAFEVSAFEYTVRSVQDAKLGDVGYIRITAFYKNTPSQFRSTLSALLEEGVTGLIFDLRNNAGGSQTAVQEVLDSIMPLGTYGMITDVNGTIVKLTTSVGSQVSVSTATLINNGTAGEAEFFAGVLQEASLTTVVGQTSAGKAKFQEYFTLDTDYSAIKLTVGEYSLLKAGSWEGVGIQPVVEAELPAEQAAVAQLLAPEEDAQVKAALDQIAKSDRPLLENVEATTPTEGDKTTAGKDSTTAKEDESDKKDKSDKEDASDKEDKDSTKSTEKTTQKTDKEDE